MSRPTVALIDRSALRANMALAQSLAPKTQIMPMVKANAYGHGMVQVAQALSEKAPAFGVACIEEALELRKAGIEQPILLLEGTFSKDEIEVAAKSNFWLMIENEPQKAAVLEAKLEYPIHVWLGIDTGMHRLGFPPDQVQGIFSQLEHSSNICSTIVIASHFACADDLGSPKTIQQQNTFKKCVASTVPDGGTDRQLSIANSAAILAWPDAHFDWQRPGYMLYGNSPFTTAQVNADMLTPAMTFKSAVISLRNIGPGESVGYTSNWTANRPSSIATITVGYGDGYPRHAPNGTPVLINNIRCPLVGRVSMDMITVDVTDLESIKIGDEVTLWGPDLSVNEIAHHCGTIGYELLTRMPSRVPRTYIN